MSSFLGLFDRRPKRHATAQRRSHARRKALAGLEFTLAELHHDLQRLAELSQTTDQDDAAAVTRETATTSRILEVLARGERFASDLSNDEAASAWRELAASTGRARLLGQGPHRVTKLKDVAAQCEQLQQFVSQELAALENCPDELTSLQVTVHLSPRDAGGSR